MKVIVRLKGGPGSGHHGHAGRPGKVGGSQPGLVAVAIGKNVYSRRAYRTVVERYGLPYNEKKRAEMEPVYNTLIAQEDEQEKRFVREWDKTYTQQTQYPILDYEALDHTKSYALEQDAGFPSTHPLSNPDVRIQYVNDAANALSYSNMVGYGGALKAASRGDTEDELYKHFSRQLPKDVTLEDVLKAMHAESQGILASHMPDKDSIVLSHGTRSIPPGRKEYKLFDVGKEYKGMSSWSLSQHEAAEFGSITIKASVPMERILSVPGLMPKQMAGVPSFLGGGRDESEFIVLSDDAMKILGIWK